MNVLLLKGQSQYNVQRYLIDLVAKGFQYLGHNITIADLLIAEESLKIPTPDLVFSYNGIGSNLLQLEKYPFYTHYTDHPFHRVDRIPTHTSNMICGFIDRRHINFVKKYINKDLNCFFLPHCAGLPEIEIPKVEKEYDIFFAGTASDLDDLESKINSFNSTSKKIIWKLIDRQIDDNSLNVDERLDAIKTEIPNYFKGNGLKEIYNYLYYADFYVRTKRRYIIIKYLSEQGYKILLYGDGWKQFNENVIIKPAIDIQSTLLESYKAKFSLSILPCFADGSHDRVVTSMLQQIPVISDTSQYLLEEFEDRKDIIYYDWKNLDNLSEKINSCNIENMVESSYKKVMNKYLFKHQVEMILNQAGLN